ncbi:MAG: hypothetical protein ACRDTM_02405 [Micromonosporaceae bacterium]
MASSLTAAFTSATSRIWSGARVSTSRASSRTVAHRSGAWCWLTGSPGGSASDWRLTTQIARTSATTTIPSPMVTLAAKAPGCVVQAQRATAATAPTTARAKT